MNIFLNQTRRTCSAIKQANASKKKTSPPHKKKFYATHTPPICLCLQPHEADPKAKSNGCNRKGFMYLRSMSDVHDKQTRSYNMSQIRSKDTKPELLVRKFLFANGFRFKLHDKKLSGTPDIVLPKLKTTIFVHGCFWHGHKDCKYFVVPKTRRKFWLDKINTNKKRDKENLLTLKKEGWKVFCIFECELKGIKQMKTLRKILTRLNKLSLSYQV